MDEKEHTIADYQKQTKFNENIDPLYTRIEDNTKSSMDVESNKWKLETLASSINSSAQIG